jgi:hypothetical protein
MKETMADTLKRAEEIINGERQNHYGSPEDSFGLISTLWQFHLDNRTNTGPLDAADVGMMMTLFKFARMYGQKWHPDNAVDACGYLAILADRIMNAP